MSSPLSESQAESFALTSEDTTQSSCSENESHSNTSDDEQINNPDQSLKGQLASWLVENHIPLIHCDKLLRILKRFHSELPKNTKTLVKGERKKVQVQECNILVFGWK